MIILAILVGVFLIAIAVPTRGRRRRASRDAARVAMAAAMVFSGVSHFADTAAFVQLLPEFVPGRTALILATGVFEILLGVGLLAPRRRREVALILAAYLVAVFPANVYVAVADVPLEGLGGGNPWLRLPFQAVYIGWVFWAVPGALEPARELVRRLRGPAGGPIRTSHGAVSR
jgi:uncharacterized membrane protein